MASVESQGLSECHLGNTDIVTVSDDACPSCHMAAEWPPPAGSSSLEADAAYNAAIASTADSRQPIKAQVQLLQPALRPE